MNSFKPRLSFVCFLASLVCIVFAPYSAGAKIDVVKTEIQKLIDAGRIRTAVVMYFDIDGGVGSLTLGEISDENRAPPNENSTIFEIGSITKVFTALLVQTLVDDELLRWDGSISQYLPEVEFANEEVAGVTFRELATHRSGLPRLPTNFTETKEPGNPMDPYAKYGEQDLISFLESFDPQELKKNYSYSNVGFAILGYVVAKMLDSSYADALDKRVFKPLEMMRTTATDADSEDLEHAAGYSNTANMEHWHFNIHAGAGAIRSTAKDMSNFIIANVFGAKGAIHQAIRSIRELQFESDHALGWITETSSEGNTVFVHGGQTGGYASFLAIDPTTQRGWVILTTSTEAEAVAKLGASFYRDVSLSQSEEFAPFTGVFKLGENQYMTMSGIDGKLQAQVTGQQPFMLQYVGDQLFELEALQFSAKFKLGKDGNATEMVWTQPGVSINAERVDDSYGIATREEIELNNEKLQKFVGRYQLGLSAIATVKQIKDRLFVQVSGQPEFRVFPMSFTRFFYKALDVEIEFEENEDGAVTGLIFHQGGEQRAPRINDEEDH